MLFLSGLLVACSAAPPSPSPIGLDYWKLQLPLEDPREVEPPELEKRARAGDLRPYFFFDEKSRLHLFTEQGSTTPNSRYPRTELREQWVPGRDDVNWSLGTGGTLEARLRLAEISTTGDGLPHRVVVLQVHGRLSKEQQAAIGADDPDAPPLLKLYWQEGRVRAFVKRPKDPNADDRTLLHKSAWADEKYTFETPVEHDFFTVRIEARRGELRVRVGNETRVFDGAGPIRWPFLNYFKAGNYLQTTDPGAYATVIFERLRVTHP